MAKVDHCAGHPVGEIDGPSKSGTSAATGSAEQPWIGGAIVSLAVTVGLALLVQSNTASANAPGERIPIQGQEHIEVGASHPPYNSDPPTSGWHYAEPAAAGYYDAPQPDEQLIHNLEHGHIWIAYDCSKLADCEGTKQKLLDLVSSYKQWKIVVTPRENQDAAIVAAGLAAKPTATTSPPSAACRRWRNKGPEQTME
jgi:hypothetical protein